MSAQRWFIQIVVCVCIGIFAEATAGFAQEPLTTRYSIRLLHPPVEAYRSTAEAINSQGQVVLQADFKDKSHRSYLWDQEKYIDLGSLGGRYCSAEDINDKGQVVGYSKTSAGVIHAFLWETGKMTDLGTLPGHKSSTAWAINNRGQVVGSSYAADGCSRAFLWDKIGGMRALGENVLSATDINDKEQITASNVLFSGSKSVDIGFDPFSLNTEGQVVGVRSWGGVHDHQMRACLFQNGKTSEITHLGGENSTAFAINKAGWIVGVSFKARGRQLAWLNKHGQVTALNDLLPADSLWDIHWARDINERGQIVGAGQYKGESRAYLLTPK